MLKNLFFLISLVFTSCSNYTENHIKNIQETFGLKIPSCYDSVKEESESIEADYVIKLTFTFNSDCFKIINNQIIERSYDSTSTKFFHWEKDDHSEYAELEIDIKEKKIYYHFYHI